MSNTIPPPLICAIGRPITGNKAGRPQPGQSYSILGEVGLTFPKSKMRQVAFVIRCQTGYYGLMARLRGQARSKIGIKIFLSTPVEACQITSLTTRLTPFDVATSARIPIDHLAGCRSSDGLILARGPSSRPLARRFVASALAAVT